MGIVDDYAYGKKKFYVYFINFISNRIGKKYFTTAIRKTAFLYEFNLPAGIVIPIGFSFNRNLNFNGRKKLFSKKVLHIRVTHMEIIFPTAYIHAIVLFHWIFAQSFILHILNRHA